jgi:ppGpp synthetase/RelA/SpoT-type nucleotidyltranferase
MTFYFTYTPGEQLMDFEHYQREGLAKYTALAKTVRKILKAAIGVETGYQLQQIKERAKQPDSLRKKLQDRGIETTTTLDMEIKDLAGCRIIFYTNSDVTKFLNSGIVQQNFEVVEYKLHHPRREAEDAAELYISNHYTVELRSERLALPEYAHFAGMRCEIQIQTILNHAWAEMAHDTIYKGPSLDGFGGKALSAIKSRMQKVSQKYLVPAGYEFQKIATDFKRLVDGKELFDENALENIVTATDNNDRAAALESFAESVLPFYDDLTTVYPEIVTKLVEAAQLSRDVEPKPIVTPFGTLPAKTYRDIINSITEILCHYRYLDIEITFNAVMSLYGLTESDDDRKPVIDVGKELAKHQVDVWLQHGPIVQQILIERIEVLTNSERCNLHSLLTTMLAELLGTEISGTTSSSAAITLHRGTITASDGLRIIRSKAIVQLQALFELSSDDGERIAVLGALRTAVATPLNTAYSDALAELVMTNTVVVIEFLTSVVPRLSYDIQQKTETWVHRCYWRYAVLPDSMKENSKLVAIQQKVVTAAFSFRDVINTNEDYVIYKTLVGYDCVYPPAWENRSFRYEKSEKYRAEQIDSLVESIDHADADIWFDRISRYAQTESNDAATFPQFGGFLERLGREHPELIFSYIDRLSDSLDRFLPRMIDGLMQSSECRRALAQVYRWLVSGKHISKIAWYLQLSKPFDEDLLQRTLDSAFLNHNKVAVSLTILACKRQFENGTGSLIEKVFLPAFKYLHEHDDFSWLQTAWNSWLDCSLIHALDEQQARTVLNAFIPYPELTGDAEYIAATIATRWPELVVKFLGERQNFYRSDEKPYRYVAIPFEVYQLKAPLACAPDAMIKGALSWYAASPQFFHYDGAKLLASVFPELSNGLDVKLRELVATGDDQKLEFVLSVLEGYEGESSIYGLIKAIVGHLTPDHRLLEKASSALDQTGVIRGEFGFAEISQVRKTLLEEWLTDENDAVKSFAANEIKFLDRRIASETRSAEASIAQRRLAYDEELTSGD